MSQQQHVVNITMRLLVEKIVTKKIVLKRKNAISLKLENGIIVLFYGKMARQTARQMANPTANFISN